MDLRRSGRDIWCMAEIVWFKRDLRVADHRPLLEAARRGPVIALYVHEPDYWALPDTSGRQWAFIAENLAELSAEIAARGGQLVLQSGDAVATIAALAEQHGATALRAHEETGNAWTHARDNVCARFAAASACPSSRSGSSACSARSLIATCGRAASRRSWQMRPCRRRNVSTARPGSPAFRWPSCPC